MRKSLDKTEMPPIPEIEEDLKKTIERSIDILEPLTVLGMYDGSSDFLYNLLTIKASQKEIKTDNTLIFIDLSTSTSIADELLAIQTGLGLLHNKANYKISDYNNARLIFADIISKEKTVLMILLPENGKVSQDFFNLLTGLRNLHNLNFSYVLFGYHNILNDRNTISPAIKKVIDRNIIFAQPLDQKSTNTLVDFLTWRYKKKILKKYYPVIHVYSGGNPGLIKSLYLQISNNPNWVRPDLNDVDLQFRIQKIMSVLNETQIELLSNLRSLKPNKVETKKLQQYGYINQSGEIFSPIIKDALISRPENSFNDLIDLNFQQMKLITLFKSTPNKIITREMVAKLIWENNWNEKYSDWAIDQLIYTLRNYIEKRNMGSLITKKKLGYVFTPSN